MFTAHCLPFQNYRMKTRSQTRAKAFKWASLPVEIRLMILAEIIHLKHPGWGSLASVCREWQYVLEKANFHTIQLGVPRLDDFEYFVSVRTRGLVRHICLEVELPRYTPTCCSKRRSASARISSVVSDAILQLFDALSTWEPRNKLALELNVYSPSDSEHWFKNLYLSSDDVESDEHTEQIIPGTSRTGLLRHDPQHGWVDGRQVQVPPKPAMLRLFRPVRLVFQEPLPPIQAVTSLIIRRQMRRCISPSEGLGPLLSSLHRLEHICYEPWAPHEAIQRSFNGRALSFIMRTELPQTLTSLVVFEDSCEFYDSLPKYPTIPPWYGLVDASEGLSAVFAYKSLCLQHLSASFMINAEEFFRQCRSNWSWSYLQSLALTSKLLRDREEKREEIEALLCRAGRVVRRMPNIHTFVLWNGGKSHACAFIYRVDREGAYVTWRGTWQLELSPHVVKAWQITASKVSSSELQLKQERIREPIRSHGDATYHLKLPCQVLDSASLWQIRRE